MPRTAGRLRRQLSADIGETEATLQWSQAGRCVRARCRGDLALAGRKCGGSAQRRLKFWLMVHCSILCDFDIDRIERYLAMPARQPEYRAGRSHRDFLVNLGLTPEALKDAIGAGLTSGPCSPAAVGISRDLVGTLLADKFANRDWIERF